MESSNKRRGVIWNALGSSIFGINTFVMLTVVNRVGKDVAETGNFGIAFTTAQMLFILGLFGANHLQMTDYKKEYAYAQYKKLKIISTLCMLPCAVLTFFLGLGSKSLELLLLLTILMMMNSWGELYQSLFFQHNRLDLSGKSLFFRTFVSLIVFVLTMYLSKGSISFSLVFTIIANVITTIFFGFKQTPPYIYDNTNGQSFSSLVSNCLPLFFSVFMMNIIINTPKYGINSLLDDTQQGYFNMLFIPVQAINLVSQFIFRPSLNEYAQAIFTGDRNRLKRKLLTQLFIICLITISAAILAFTIGVQVAGWVFASDFTGFRYVLTTLIIGSGVFALCQLGYYIMVIQRKNRLIMIFYIFSLLVEILLCYLLIPVYGLLGASLSFAGAHIILVSLYCCYIVGLMRKMGNDGI